MLFIDDKRVALIGIDGKPEIVIGSTPYSRGRESEVFDWIHATIDQIRDELKGHHQ